MWWLSRRVRMPMKTPGSSKGAIGWAAFVSALYSLITPVSSWSQEWFVQPTLRLQQEYNDNIRLSPVLKDNAFGTVAAGELDIRKLTDTMTFRAFAHLDGIAYSSTSVPNDGTALLRLFTTYDTSERSQLKFRGSFVRDSSLRSAADQFIDPGDLEPGISDIRVPRSRLALVPAWEYSLSERSGLELGYEFVGVGYYGGNKDPSGLQDYRFHRPALTYSYKIGELSTIKAFGEGLYFRSPGQVADDEYTGGALWGGIDHDFSETLRAELALGAYHTRFDRETIDGDKTGGLFDLTLTKNTELTEWSGTIQRDLLPSGVGSLRQVDQFVLGFYRNISPKLGFDFRTRYFRAEDLGVSPGNKRRYALVEPRLDWKLTERWLLTASYRYRWDKRRDNPSADSNRVAVAISYTWPDGPEK